MNSFVLLKDDDKYSGQYVATQSFSNHKVVSSGKDVKIVREEARARGFDNPVVFYVPPTDTVHIY